MGGYTSEVPPIPSAVYTLYHLGSSLLAVPWDLMSVLFTMWVPCCSLHSVNSSVPCGICSIVFTLYNAILMKGVCSNLGTSSASLRNENVPFSHNPLSGCMWRLYYIPYQGLGYVCEYIMMIHCHLMEASVHISLAVCLINCYGARWEGAVPTGMHYACKHMSIRVHVRTLYMRVYEHIQALRMRNCESPTALHM